MIDKKPFRVTNEQAKAVIICRGGGWECPGDCPNYGLDTCPVDNTTADKIAADLLDSRELIDKQEDIIKEMRLSLVIAKAYNCDCGCNSCRETLSNINSILEKTKDYA